MEITYINKKLLFKSKPLTLNKTITSTEVEMLRLPNGDLYKRFYVKEGTYFSDKLATLTELNKNKKLLNHKEFVLPKSLTSTGGKIDGYTMAYIPGENLDNILNNYNVSQSDKLKYLKQAGDIIAKVSNLRKYKELSNFYIGDIHSQNFIVDHDGVKLVDMDSVRIGKLDGFPIKNTYPESNFKKFKGKYEFNDKGVIANQESDIAMYNMMVLNFLSKTKMQTKTIEDFYSYLTFAKKQGMPEELVNEFMNIYSQQKGMLVKDYLKLIKDPVGKYNYEIYEKFYDYTK